MSYRDDLSITGFLPPPHSSPPGPAEFSRVDAAREIITSPWAQTVRAQFNSVFADISGGPLLGQISGHVKILELHPGSNTPSGRLRQDQASSSPRGLIPLPPRLTYPNSSLKKRGSTVQTPLESRQGEEDGRMLYRDASLEGGRELSEDSSRGCGQESSAGDSEETLRRHGKGCSHADRRGLAEVAGPDVAVTRPTSRSPKHLREGASARCSVRPTRAGDSGDGHGSETGVRTSGPKAGASEQGPMLQTTAPQGDIGLPGTRMQEVSSPSHPASPRDCNTVKTPAPEIGCGNDPLAMLQILSPPNLAFIGRVADSMILQLPSSPGSLPNGGAENAVSINQRSSTGKTQSSPLCSPTALQPTPGEQSAADVRVTSRVASGNGAFTVGQPRDLLVAPAGASLNSDVGHMRQQGSAAGMPGTDIPGGGSVGRMEPSRVGGGGSSVAQSQTPSWEVPGGERVHMNSIRRWAGGSHPTGCAQIPVSPEMSAGRGVSAGSQAVGPERGVCIPPLPLSAAKAMRQSPRAPAGSAVHVGSLAAAGQLPEDVVGGPTSRSTAPEAAMEPSTKMAPPAKLSGSSRRRNRSGRGGRRGESPIPLQGVAPLGTDVPLPAAAGSLLASSAFQGPLSLGPDGQQLATSGMCMPLATVERHLETALPVSTVSETPHSQLPQGASEAVAAATPRGAPSQPVAAGPALRQHSDVLGPSAPPVTAGTRVCAPTSRTAAVAALLLASGLPRVSAPGSATTRGAPSQTATVPSPRDASGSLVTSGLSKAAAKRRSAPHSPMAEMRSDSPQPRAAGTPSLGVATATPEAAPPIPAAPVATVVRPAGTPGASASCVDNDEAGTGCSLPAADDPIPPQASGSTGPAPGRAALGDLKKQKKEARKPTVPRNGTEAGRRLGRPRSAKETGKLQPLVVIGRDASPAPKQNEFQVSRRGRVRIPPLAYWANQSVRIDHKAGRAFAIDLGFPDQLNAGTTVLTASGPVPKQGASKSKTAPQGNGKKRALSPACSRSPSGDLTPAAERQRVETSKDTKLAKLKPGQNKKAGAEEASPSLKKPRVDVEVHAGKVGSAKGKKRAGGTAPGTGDTRGDVKERAGAMGEAMETVRRRGRPKKRGDSVEGGIVEALSKDGAKGSEVQTDGKDKGSGRNEATRSHGVKQVDRTSKAKQVLTGDVQKVADARQPRRGSKRKASEPPSEKLCEVSVPVSASQSCQLQAQVLPPLPVAKRKNASLRQDLPGTEPATSPLPVAGVCSNLADKEGTATSGGPTEVVKTGRCWVWRPAKRRKEAHEASNGVAAGVMISGTKLVSGQKGPPTVGQEQRGKAAPSAKLTSKAQHVLTSLRHAAVSICPTPDGAKGSPLPAAQQAGHLPRPKGSKRRQGNGSTDGSRDKIAIKGPVATLGAVGKSRAKKAVKKSGMTPGSRGRDDRYAPSRQVSDAKGVNRSDGLSGDGEGAEVGPSGEGEASAEGGGGYAADIWTDEQTAALQASGGPRLSLFGVSRMPILHATSMKLSEGEVGLLRIAEAGSPRGNNAAYFVVEDPTKPGFWNRVAKHVPGKTASECFSKIFSSHPTPAADAKPAKPRRYATKAPLSPLKPKGQAGKPTAGALRKQARQAAWQVRAEAVMAGQQRAPAVEGPPSATANLMQAAARQEQTDKYIDAFLARHGPPTRWASHKGAARKAGAASGAGAGGSLLRPANLAATLNLIRQEGAGRPPPSPSSADSSEVDDYFSEDED